MSVGSADLHKAVRNVWVASGLDAEFKKNWDEADRDEFDALNDQAGMAGQPFPYCIFEQEPSSVVSRDSGHSDTEKHEHRLIPWVFRVHAKQIATSSETAKETAARLIGFIMQKYGGHPEASPLDITLDNGSVLLAQYQSDIGIRTGDKEYQWNLNYLFLVDVPVIL